jgi:hypothetical protein
MTDELRHIILKLKDRIADSEGYEEGLNEASWTRQIGILITRNEANLIVGELEKHLPTDAQKEAWNDALCDSVCDHDYVYKILHDHTAADVCTKCGNIKKQTVC